MSIKIDVDAPISMEHYEYLRDRPFLYRGRSIDDLEWIDETVPEGFSEEEYEGDPGTGLEDIDDSEDLEDEDEDLEDEDDEDLEEEDDEEDEDDDVDLSSLSISELREIAAERGLEIPKKVKKDDLVDLLS